MKMPSQKQCHWLAFLAALILIGASYYFQKVIGLEPCALCLIQRGLMIGLAVLFFIGILAKNNFQRLINTLIFITAALGMLVSGRQTYLQYWAPEDLISCGPDLSFIWDHLSWGEAATYLLNGAGSCADIKWQWLGLSMPTWVFLCFLGFALIAMINLLRRKQ